MASVGTKQNASERYMYSRSSIILRFGTYHKLKYLFCHLSRPYLSAEAADSGNQCLRPDGTLRTPKLQTFGNKPDMNLRVENTPPYKAGTVPDQEPLLKVCVETSLT